MTRANLLLTTTLVIVTSLAAAGFPRDATAFGSTCFGVPATIARQGGTVYGTGGADAIVAIDTSTIYGLGGDDLICTANLSFNLQVIDGGAGDDRIEACSREAAPEWAARTCALKILGGSGADELSKATEIWGGSGNDTLKGFQRGYGESGNDSFLEPTLEIRALCDGGSGIDTVLDCSIVVNVP